jgi:hypothetical protein
MIEVLKQLVDALENHSAIKHPQQIHYRDEAIEAGKQAIAELESQEPVAWMVTGPYEKRPFVDINSARSSRNGLNKGFGEDVYMISSLYSHPPQRTEGRVCCQQYDICLEPCTSRGRHLAQRTWVGLTDDELCDIWYKESLDWMEYGKAIEAKLKEKNT